MKSISGILIFLGGSMIFPSLAAADVTLSLDPVGGEISGSAGTDIGWGFTLDNDTGMYLLIDESVFNSVQADGTYVDYTGSAPELGPSPYSTEYYAPFVLGLSGIGEFDISSDPSVVIGASWDGALVLTYDLYTSDPSMDPNAQPFSTGNTVSADASIDIVAPTTVTPEPALGWWAGAGCLVAVFAARRRHTPGRTILTR